MNPDIPTGDSGEIVRQYYDYLYAHYLSQIAQRTGVPEDTLLWVLLWVFILTSLFYAYTRWQRTTNESNEPYPVESYNGYIEEANGPVGTFLRLFFVGMFIWLLTMTVLSLMHGQIY
jgi:RsiW-degrading membrane proteinase PrsW (M82 family)